MAAIGLGCTAFPPTAGAVDDLQVLKDGRIMVGQRYGYVDGKYLREREYVAVLERDGSAQSDFGDGGVIATPGGTAAAATRDGKVIVVSGRRGWVSVYRYRANGTLDRSFSKKGRDGVSRVSVKIATISPEDVVVRRNGEILVGVIWYCHGATRGCGYTQSYLHLLRFSPKGRFRGFGGTLGNEIHGLSLAPGKKVLAVGYGDEGDSLAARFNARGQEDDTFDRDGWTVLSDVYELADVAAQSDGSAVIAASEGVVRLAPNGHRDQAFGASGLAVCPGPPQGIPNATIPGSFDAVAVQPDQRLLAAGTSCGLTRFTAQGLPDSSFAGGGRVEVPAESYSRVDVAAEPDGRIVTAAFSGKSRTFEVRRFLPDGTPDPSFGTAGTATIPVP
jgi:uncharacterized delta-60 repeat protein